MHNTDAVISLLQAGFGLLDWAGEKERVRHLCAWACVKSANKENAERFEDVEYVSENGIVQLPNVVIKVDRVRRKTDRLPPYDRETVRYTYTDGYIKLLDYLTATVLVDYMAVPVGDDGYPLIAQRQLDYCVAYVLQTYMREQLVQQKMHIGTYREFKEEAQVAYNRAMKTKVTVDDMEASAWLMRNGIFFPNFDILKR